MAFSAQTGLTGGIMNAAKCVVAVAYTASCDTMSKRQEVCMYVCCCDAFPIRSSRGRMLKQLCVDRMMAAKGVDQRGIVSSPAYFMNPAGAELITPLNSKTLRFQAKLLKELRIMENLPAQKILPTIRIPDIVFTEAPGQQPTTNNIDMIYDIKFPGDRWRDGQFDDYVKIAGGDTRKVQELNPTNCACQGKESYEKVYEQVADKVHAEANTLAQSMYQKLQEFVVEHKDVAGVELMDIQREMERIHWLDTASPMEKALFSTVATLPLGPLAKGGQGAAKALEWAAKILRMPGGGSPVPVPVPVR